MKLRFSFITLMVFLYLLVQTAGAQVTGGTPPFSASGGGPIDIIDLGNLNVHLSIPMLNKPGRIAFSYTMGYDSAIWSQLSSGGSLYWEPTNNFGWVGQTQGSAGYSGFSAPINFCYTNGRQTGEDWVSSNWVYYDKHNTPHPVSGHTAILTGTCGNVKQGFTATSNDGAGHTVTATPGTSLLNGTIYVDPRKGGVFNVSPGLSSNSSVVAQDDNGNQITVSVNGSGAGTFTDTLGQQVLTTSGVAPSNTTFTYTAPSGASAAYTMKYTTYTVLTNFGCGVNEFGPGSESLVSEIDLPDQAVNSNDNTRSPMKPRLDTPATLQGAWLL